MTQLQQEWNWIQAAQQGDADAFEALVTRYEKQVYALAFRLCGNAEDATDAAQEAFLAAWQGLPFFRGEASFSTWLYRLTHNACVSLLRRENRHQAMAGPSLDDEETHLDLPSSAISSPESEAERAELREDIEKALQAMTPEHREVLILREIHQRSYDEIAEILDLDLGTVKSRINRGRKQLRNFLLRSGNFSEFAASKNTEKEGC